METSSKHQTYFMPEDLEITHDHRIKKIHQDIHEKISEPDYPCVGAKASLNSNQYRIGIYGDMGCKKTTLELGADLKKYIQETKESNSEYLTLIAVFSNEITSELDFEKRLWGQLQELHDSEKEGQLWDPEVSDDPENKNFSYSFDGTAFFIVGLHPKASRKARNFKYPAMAFNLHQQFTNLRENGQFENMKNIIMTRDEAYDGSINPMLSDFGEHSEAPQYSGRKVDELWKCPFFAGNIQNKT